MAGQGGEGGSRRRPQPAMAALRGDFTSLPAVSALLGTPPYRAARGRRRSWASSFSVSANINCNSWQRRNDRISRYQVWTATSREGVAGPSAGVLDKEFFYGSPRSDRRC